MRYDGPRRKSKLQKACEALDPGVRLIDRSFSGGGRWNTGYEVQDGAGVVIGYTDPKAPPRFAWSMALETLQRRARIAACTPVHKGTFSFGCGLGVVWCDACGQRVTNDDAKESFATAAAELPDA